MGGRKRWWLGIAGACGAVLVALAVGCLNAPEPPIAPAARLTFFSPSGYPPELAARTHFGMINAASPAQVRESLRTTRQHGARLQIDFSEVLLRQRPAAALNGTYTDEGGTVRRKSFAPLAANKVKDLLPDAEIAAALAPYWPVLKAYRRQVAAVFLVDEPYMHGVSRPELERAAARVRQLLQDNGLARTRIGVVFSGAMFDAPFAHLIAGRANAYVAGIEHYHRKQVLANLQPAQRQDSGHARWAEQYARQRLTTYDLSGNLYLGGGIPRGFDVVAYNLYTATLLQDGVHDGTLAWFARRRLSAACTPFHDMSSRMLSQRLSFYRDGPVDADGQAADRQLLDQVFACKSESVLALLRQHAPEDVQAFQLWGESSANGFLEFDAAGNVEAAQPAMLVEARVFDEVARTLAFRDRHPDAFAGGVVFFIYDDAVDRSIDLRIAGAKAMPSVTHAVFERIGKHPPEPCGWHVRCWRPCRACTWLSRIDWSME